MMRMLTHPNIIQFVDTFQWKKHQCIVMTLCDGGDLEAKLKIVHSAKVCAEMSITFMVYTFFYAITFNICMVSFL